MKMRVTKSKATPSHSVCSCVFMTACSAIDHLPFHRTYRNKINEIHSPFFPITNISFVRISNRSCENQVNRTKLFLLSIVRFFFAFFFFTRRRSLLTIVAMAAAANSLRIHRSLSALRLRMLLTASSMFHCSFCSLAAAAAASILPMPDDWWWC